VRAAVTAARAVARQRGQAQARRAHCSQPPPALRHTDPSAAAAARRIRRADRGARSRGEDGRQRATRARADKQLDARGLCGLDTRSVAELLVEVGDPRRFTEGGFARFNGTAPLPASTAEGPGEPVRDRYNPGGNRRINAVLHRMAITQLRCEPRAQAIFANARTHSHTKKEARRILKRHLSDVTPPHDP
jgi:Transposase IS116/IS110/IS902 family